MTYQQAIAVRTLQLHGVEVPQRTLNEAIAIIKNTRTPTPWPGEGKREQPDPKAE